MWSSASSEDRSHLLDKIQQRTVSARPYYLLALLLFLLLFDFLKFVLTFSKKSWMVTPCKLRSLSPKGRPTMNSFDCRNRLCVDVMLWPFSDIVIHRDKNEGWGLIWGSFWIKHEVSRCYSSHRFPKHSNTNTIGHNHLHSVNQFWLDRTEPCKVFKDFFYQCILSIDIQRPSIKRGTIHP